MHLARKVPVLVFSAFLFLGCGDSEPSAEPSAGAEAIDPSKRRADVTDIDGNVYKTVQIGRQVWMAENLRTTRYRNGEDIPYARTDEAWTTEEVGMRCAYEHDDALADQYGQLYNFYAVQDERGLCPSGWHVPSDEEWNELEGALGLSSVDAKQTGGRGIHGAAMKSEAWDGTNSSGFSALPGGFRSYGSGFFSNGGLDGNWWSSSADGATYAWSRGLISLGLDGDVLRDSNYQENGFSVRCVRDE
jgi:uncharacterized protein (TIGR02145 family)